MSMSDVSGGGFVCLSMWLGRGGGKGLGGASTPAARSAQRTIATGGGAEGAVDQSVLDGRGDQKRGKVGVWNHHHEPGRGFSRILKNYNARALP